VVSLPKGLVKSGTSKGGSGATASTVTQSGGGGSSSIAVGANRTGNTSSVKAADDPAADTPPDTGSPKYELCRKLIQAARDALAMGDIPEAKRNAFRAAAANRSAGGDMAADIDALNEEINGSGQRLVEEADKLNDAGKPVAAIARYTAVVEAFASLPVADDARKKLAVLRQSIADKPWASLVETEAAGEFNELVAQLKAEWKQSGAAVAEGQSVDAHEIILRMVPDKRQAVIRRILDMANIYGTSTYAPRLRTLIDKVKAAEVAQLAPAAQ
jgi:hypothetical protein